MVIMYIIESAEGITENIELKSLSISLKRLGYSYFVLYDLVVPDQLKSHGCSTKAPPKVEVL
jgi:hypothetical protein